MAKVSMPYAGGPAAGAPNPHDGPEPSRFYLVGAGQRRHAILRKPWQQFDRALIYWVDVSTGASDCIMEHVPDPAVLTADGPPNVLFKAGSLVDDLLYLCTETEVIVLRLPDFERVAYMSLPFFNDVHHVLPLDDGGLAVAVTGLDLVADVGLDGSVRRLWSALEGEEPRVDPAIDYRRLVTRKPHRAHPNFVFRADGETWTTRFEQRDAFCLTRPGRRIRIGVERPHDGIVVGDRVHFTTVDGHVVVAEAATDRVVEVVDLYEIDSSPYALGWCRGLLPLDERRIVVGFSRIRPTRIRRNLRWMKHRVGMRETRDSSPSRIVCYDLGVRRKLWEHPVEEAGLNAIYSIHPVVDSASRAVADDASASIDRVRRASPSVASASRSPAGDS